MRWNTPELPSAAGVATFAVMSITWVPILAVGAALYGAVWGKRWLVGPRKEWRPWFAWFPVWIEGWPDHGSQWVWLEWVERRCHSLLHDTQVRLTAPPPGTP